MHSHHKEGRSPEGHQFAFSWACMSSLGIERMDGQKEEQIENEG